MKLRNLPTILLFGSLWGIIEATVGYVLHFLPVSIYISGTVLFPFVTWILYKAYKLTNSKSALLAIGLIAAGIKAVDFFLPFGSPFKIINPMLSIIFESLAILLVISFISDSSFNKKIQGFVFASVAWRLMYIAYSGIQYLSTGFVSTYLASLEAFLLFTLAYAILSSILSITINYLDTLVVNKQKISIFKRVNPYVSLVTFFIAILLTYLF